MIDLSLNNGVYCSPRCLEVAASRRLATDFRLYSDCDNSKLRSAIAQDCGPGVTPANIFVHNGSGPILKEFIPQQIRRGVMSSPWRVMKHLAGRSGYPIIAPVPTYDKVLRGAATAGIGVREIPLRTEDSFQLDPSRLAEAIRKGPGLVYLCNPNNPTGSVLLNRAQLVPLIENFPDTTFLIDEAYVHYLAPERHEYMAGLAVAYPNVVCLRTFSFAHGLAAAHLGFLVASENTVARLEKQVTGYRIPELTESLAIAALEDETHLDYVRAATAAARDYLIQGMGQHPNLRPFPSEANFVLVHVRGEIAALDLANRLKQRGILVRTFEAERTANLSEMFRVTVGTEEENKLFLEVLEAVFSRTEMRFA